MGYLSQLFVLYPNLSVQENLNFIGLLYGMSIWDHRRRIRELLDLVELSPDRNKTANFGGMQRRLGLAASLMHRPKILLVDEPTAGIDPILREKFWNEFRRLNQQEGTTIIVTTQYVTEAEYSATTSPFCRREAWRRVAHPTTSAPMRWAENWSKLWRKSFRYPPSVNCTICRVCTTLKDQPCGGQSAIALNRGRRSRNDDAPNRGDL